jgi:hypothetical protein
VWLAAVASLVGPPDAGGDVRYEATVRIVDALGRGTAEFDQRIVTAVSAVGIREEVVGSRTITTRRGGRYSRPGHRVLIHRLDEATSYDLDLDAGSYTRRTFQGQTRERERALRDAEAAFRTVPPEESTIAPAAPAGGPTEVNGLSCSPRRIEASRVAALAPLRQRDADPQSPARFRMSLELCVTPETDWSAGLNTIERRVRQSTGETDEYLDRLLAVLARRRDLFAVFDDLHHRLERERRKLGGLVVRWTQELRGPHRGGADVVIFRLEGVVTTLAVGPVARGAFEVPPTLTPVEHHGQRSDRPEHIGGKNR